MEDRRLCERIEIPLRVIYKSSVDRERFRESISRDVSGGGISFYVNETRKPNDVLKVLFYPKDNGKPITSVCRAIWVKEEEANSFLVGAKFIEIRNDHRFIEFICRQIIHSKANWQTV